MKLYDYALSSIRSQIDQAIALRALNCPEEINDDDELKDSIQELLLKDSLSMAIAVLARADVLNDMRNDQIQSSARELVRIIANRLEIDAEGKYGIPL
jgi:hypothetical protein